MATRRAAILGLDTALGAYLARLLGARGYDVKGTGGADLLSRLGIAGDVALAEMSAEAADGADEVYDLRYVDGVLPAAGRIVVAVDPGDARRRAALAAERAAGRFVATALVWPHESRLGPGTTAIARIVAAMSAGTNPDPDALASSIDCGWTAEYVDPLWRLLQRPAAAEVAVATGTLLNGGQAAEVASARFRRPAPAAVVALGGVTGNTTRAAEALGWRAVTRGTDLVEVLCEGAAPNNLPRSI